MKRTRWTNCWRGVLLIAAACAALSHCGRPESTDPGADAPLRVWAHAGREEERDALRAFVARYNAGNPRRGVEIEFLPDGGYNAQVQAAALANALPDILEFDGPFLYNYVWQGRLRPLDELLPDGLRENVIPSVLEQGTYRERLYSLGMFDSALVIYGRRSLLEAAGVRIPEGTGDPWSIEEFEAALAALAATAGAPVLDLKLNYRGEWFTYGFYPALASAGGGLVDLDNGPRAEGALNGPASVRALERIQAWIAEKGWVDPNLDDDAFTGGRVALSWVGHWEYPRYAEAFGDDLALMPLPDFGHGLRTGQGSWSWAITRNCRDPEAAMDFLAFLMKDAQVLEMTAANGAVPGTFSAIAQSPALTDGGPRALFAALLTEGHAVPRPITPAYNTITSVFQEAFADIIRGTPVQAALDRAARAIDQDIEDNRGYPDLAAFLRPELGRDLKDIEDNRGYPDLE